jgi:hypothetical protein
MEKKRLDTSVLDNCKISFIGAGARVDNYVTRAIIELAGDITPAMLRLSKVIENCGYNSEVKTLAFRFQNMPVVVLANTITVNNMWDLETAQKFLDWLKSRMETAV